LQVEELERVAAIKALERLAEEGQTVADVFAIAELGRLERRKKKDKNLIDQIAQGKSPAGTTDRSKLNYGGDRSFVAPDRVSIHLRYFDLLDPFTRTVQQTNVPWYAVHIPPGLEKTYLIQSDPI
jgi:hypothetical protein